MWPQPSSDRQFLNTIYSATLPQQSRKPALIVLVMTSKPIATVDSIVSLVTEIVGHIPPTGLVDVHAFLQVAQETIHQSVVVIIKHMTMSGQYKSVFSCT